MSWRADGSGHVAILTSNFAPEQTSTGRTVTEFAEFLAHSGLPVVVATSMPYYPQWRIWPEYAGRLWRTERNGRLTVLRSWHFVRPRPSTLTRLLHESTLSLMGLANMVRAIRGSRVVYVVSPALSFALVGLVVARLFGVRRVLIVKDVMPDAAVELGMLRNRAMIAVSRMMARSAYALADEIHTLGDGMRRRIARDTAQPGKIRIVPDTIDAAELADVPGPENEFRRRFVPDGTFAVLHTGNMGKKQDLFLVLRAARRLQDDRSVHFFVVGDGAVKDDFLRMRAEWKLENVSHHPLQDRWMLRHMLSGADAVLVSQLPEVVDIVVPSKLVTAMGAGAMVIAACPAESETAKLVGESGGGMVIAPSDDVALADAIERIRSGRVDVAGCRQRARAYGLRRFERSALYGPIAREFLDVPAHGARDVVAAPPAREPAVGEVSTRG